MQVQGLDTHGPCHDSWPNHTKSFPIRLQVSLNCSNQFLRSHNLLSRLSSIAYHFLLASSYCKIALWSAFSNHGPTYPFGSAIYQKPLSSPNTWLIDHLSHSWKFLHLTWSCSFSYFCCCKSLCKLLLELQVWSQILNDLILLLDGISSKLWIVIIHSSRVSLILKWYHD